MKKERIGSLLGGISFILNSDDSYIAWNVSFGFIQSRKRAIHYIYRIRSFLFGDSNENRIRYFRVLICKEMIIGNICTSKLNTSHIAQEYMIPACSCEYDIADLNNRAVVSAQHYICFCVIQLFLSKGRLSGLRLYFCLYSIDIQSERIQFFGV